jgi:hypothetical protein
MLLVFGFTLWAFYSLKEEAGAFNGAAKDFDHSLCQYPTRQTNPVDGCDNSDPCSAENAAKGGSGRCEDKTAVEPPDPKLNYIDAEGNEFDDNGNLVKPWQGQPLVRDGK